MEIVSRYIEFCDANFSVFSLELGHLLFATASEVDVVAKLLCEQIQPAARRSTINDYTAILIPAIPELPVTEVFVPRYGLSFKPWSNWAKANNPLWWRSYNKVKNQRDAYFNEATLKSALNALGALLIVTFHYYSRMLAVPPAQVLEPKGTTQALLPESIFLRFSEDLYYSRLLFKHDAKCPNNVLGATRNSGAALAVAGARERVPGVLQIIRRTTVRRLSGHSLVRTLTVLMPIAFFSSSAAAQSAYPFVSKEFAVPATLETKEFRLRMLTVNDAVKDYDAVMTSVEHLKTIWPDSGWRKRI